MIASIDYCSTKVIRVHEQRYSILTTLSRGEGAGISYLELAARRTGQRRSIDLVFAEPQPKLLEGNDAAGARIPDEHAQLGFPSAERKPGSRIEEAHELMN